MYKRQTLQPSFSYTFEDVLQPFISNLLLTAFEVSVTSVPGNTVTMLLGIFTLTSFKFKCKFLYLISCFFAGCLVKMAQLKTWGKRAAHRELALPSSKFNGVPCPALPCPSVGEASSRQNTVWLGAGHGGPGGWQVVKSPRNMKSSGSFWLAWLHASKEKIIALVFSLCKGDIVFSHF